MICVDSGYELMIGGNGGIKLRSTDLLCKVATKAEAMQVIEADRTSVRYRSRRADDGDLRDKLRVLAQERRRFGYRRLHIALHYSQRDTAARTKCGHELTVVRTFGATRGVDERSVSLVWGLKPKSSSNHNLKSVPSALTGNTASLQGLEQT